MTRFSGVKKAFRYEAFRFYHTPKFWVALVAVLLVFIAFMFVHYFVLSPELEPIQVTDRQAAFDEIREKVDYSRGFMEEYADRLTEEDIDSLTNMIAEGEFYLSTQTLPTDYANDCYLAEKHRGRERLGFMFQFGTIGEFVFWAVCIAVCAFVFTRDYSSNNYKNLYAGTTGRQAVFWSKFLFSFAVCGAVCLLLFLIALIFGLTDQWQFMVFYKGTYRAISTTTVFLAQYLGTVVAGMIFGSLAILLGTLSKKVVFGVAFPFVFYLFTILIAYTYVDLAYAAPKSIDTVHSYIPIVCLQLHVGAFDSEYLIKILVHFAFAAACTFASYKLSCKASV